MVSEKGPDPIDLDLVVLEIVLVRFQVGLNSIPPRLEFAKVLPIKRRGLS